ncbi:CAP-associated domain-containing protein [Bacillus sp. JCM 19041]|uniref:CAP-associated domain-containing protein n=1 Tax=Bacillus sp. JCM 19041 TaxID=1460637 RepID=UPI0006CFDBBB
MVDPAKNAVASSVDSIRSWSDSTELSFNSFDDFLDSLFGDFIRNDANEWTEVEPPSLTEPDEQLFSIHSIELGDSRESVEEELGEEMRSSENEYNVDWVTYHEDYHHFVMVAYDDENIVKGSIRIKISLPLQQRSRMEVINNTFVIN